MDREKSKIVEAIRDALRKLGDALDDAIAPRRRPEPRLVPIPVYSGERAGRGARRG